MASETDILAQMRKAYRADGYEVDIRPRIDLPGGGTLEPDLMARKAGRTVLVGVRRLGAGADGARRLQRLAEAAHGREDWSFRLVLAEGEGPDVPPVGLEMLKGRLAEARRLYRRGDRVPALLYVWALLTGASRHRLGSSVPDAGDPVALARALAAEGVVEPADAEWLDRVAADVAALAGGDVLRAVDPALFDRVCAFCLSLCRPGRDRGGPDVRL